MYAPKELVQSCVNIVETFDTLSVDFISAAMRTKKRFKKYNLEIRIYEQKDSTEKILFSKTISGLKEIEEFKIFLMIVDQSKYSLIIYYLDQVLDYIINKTPSYQSSN